MDIFRERVKEHLKLREGYRDVVYLDTLGKPTTGTGHLMSKEQLKTYPVGSTVPKNVLEGWLEEDMESAIQAAKRQAEELRIDSLDFLLALVSVNFQLGVNWSSKFPSAWKHLKNKEYERAISEIEYVKEGSNKPSAWKEQSPVRVQDFVDAIRKLK